MVITKRLTVSLQTLYNMIDWCVHTLGSASKFQWDWCVYTGATPKTYPADHTVVEFKFADPNMKFQFLLVFADVL